MNFLLYWEVNQIFIEDQCQQKDDFFSMSLNCNSVVCVRNDDAVFCCFKISLMIGNKTFGNYAICKINDTGCHAKPYKKVESSNVLKGRIKIHKIFICDNGYSQSSCDKRIYCWVFVFSRQKYWKSTSVNILPCRYYAQTQMVTSLASILMTPRCISWIKRKQYL